MRISLKVSQYKKSTELPWSTRTFAIANLSMSTVMTMGSSWVGSMAVKSSRIKVIGGMCGHLCVEVEWTD